MDRNNKMKIKGMRSINNQNENRVFKKQCANLEWLHGSGVYNTIWKEVPLIGGHNAEETVPTVQ